MAPFLSAASSLVQWVSLTLDVQCSLLCWRTWKLYLYSLLSSLKKPKRKSKLRGTNITWRMPCIIIKFKIRKPYAFRERKKRFISNYEKAEISFWIEEKMAKFIRFSLINHCKSCSTKAERPSICFWKRRLILNETCRNRRFNVLLLFSVALHVMCHTRTVWYIKGLFNFDS